MPPMLAQTLNRLGAVDDRTNFDRLLALAGGLRAVRQLLRTSETVLDVGELEPEAIREWLRALPIAQSEWVEIAWPADTTAVRMRFDRFAKCFDDLWYPAQDDVVVVAERPGAVQILVLDHEEHFAYGALSPPVYAIPFER
ncbi:hypothetical protein F3087_39725 [Nocardia colli]|uniref:Uncharacterized protein n=1 Tax=Nocardia colli TaxID=2545717 RepID=A0A5N0E1H0_9NOCA|nr:hypothetical protein [Nocardia colli]KAA8881964.1 hypothetical protein F3087_39725 [Nocardia colli]